VYPTKDLTVTTIYGKKVKGVGRSHKIYVQIQELELQAQFYVIPLDDIDVVLSVKRLNQLGTYTTNLEKQFMQFNWIGWDYKLCGVESSNHQKIDLQLMKNGKET
jgi:hypothetical protein